MRYLGVKLTETECSGDCQGLGEGEMRNCSSTGVAVSLTRRISSQDLLYYCIAAAVDNSILCA